MYAILDGPYERVASRRRASTAASTGLDYSSSYQVDEDILSRIRSLLLSRNGHHPPPTPHTSDEQPRRFSRDNNPTKFDFTSAKSVAKLANAASIELELPKDTRSLSKSGDMAVDQRPTEPDLRSSDFQPPLRTSSSVDNMRSPFDDDLVHATELTCCPPCTPEDGNKRSWLPKLVLQDAKKPDKTIKSCIEISKKVPENDAQIHQDELNCCPPCDPNEKNQSKYTIDHATWPGRSLMAEPSDLACFLAGCPPGYLNCQKHPRNSSRSQRSSIQDRRITDNIKTIAGDLVKDVTKITQSITSAVAVKSPVILKDIPEDGRQRPYSPLRSPIGERVDVAAFVPSSRDTESNKIPRNAAISPSESSLRSSATSNDKFPHAVQSLEAAAGELTSRPFSTTISTNFSLPGPKLFEPPGNEVQRRTISRKPVQRKLSNALPGPRIDSTPWKDIADDDVNIGEALEARSVPMIEGIAINKGSEYDNSIIRSRRSTRSLKVEPTAEKLQPKRSIASLRSMNPKSPSILSGASRTSALRHALFKPSLSKAQPMDLGLPIPPMLTPTTSMSEIIMPPKQDKRRTETALPKAEGSPKTPVVEVDDNLAKLDTSPPNTNKIADESTSRSKSAETIVRMDTPNVEDNVTKLRQLKSNLNDGGNSTAEGSTLLLDEIKPVSPKGAPTDTTKHDFASLGSSSCASRAPTETLTHDYWGFKPAVKESVQDAIQFAVRKAVVESSPPTVTEPKKAARAYRRLVADSLTEAARDADIYLRRPSVWKRELALNDVPGPLEVVDMSIMSDETTAASVPDSMEPQIGNSNQPSVAAMNEKPTTEPQTQSETRNSEMKSKFEGDNNRICPDPSKHHLSSNPVTQGKHSLATGSQIKLEIKDNISIPTRGSNSKKDEPPPLEVVDELQTENHKQSWKLPSPFRKSSVAKYVAIPTRHSSVNRVLSPKTGSANSPSIVSPKGALSPSRRRSLEQIVLRKNVGLRSVSSEGSFKSSASDKDKPDQQLLQGIQHDELEDSASLSHRPSQDRLRRKNTVHWLRDLLSSNGPYEPRLTALPPRTRRGQDSSASRVRSQTAPTMPVSELFLSATPMVENSGDQKAVDDVQGDERALVSEKFTRTINDLENLLNEALVIARLAAERNDTMLPANLLNDAQSGYRGISGVKSRRIKPATYESGQSDDMSDAGSVHESLRSYTGSSDSAAEDSLDEGDADNGQERTYDRIRTAAITISEQPNTNNHTSGWPPTGRVSTPYPPNTLPPSRASVVVDIPRLEGLNDLNQYLETATKAVPGSKTDGSRLDKLNTLKRSVELIQGADPRSKPVETNLESSVKISFAAANDLETDKGRASQVEFTSLEPFKTISKHDTKARNDSNSPGRISPTKQIDHSRRGTRQSAGALEQENVFENNDDKTSIKDDSIPLPKITPRGTAQVCAREHSADDHEAIKTRLTTNSVPGKRKVREYIKEFRHPPIQPRASSMLLRKQAEQPQSKSQPRSHVQSMALVKGQTFTWQDVDRAKIEPGSQVLSDVAASAKDLRPYDLHSSSIPYSHSYDGSQITHSEEIDFNHGYGHRQHGAAATEPAAVQTTVVRQREIVELKDIPSSTLPITSVTNRKKQHMFSLKNERHVSLRDHKGFSLARSHKRQKIARDWSPGRKRFCAAVACLSTALVGILVGIYAGETPAIQYYIVDFHHYTVLGNVFFFIGLSIPTFLFWPLPLLHGRKPYILGAMSLAMPLLFPQALAVGEFRSPYVVYWRVALILPRALMGLCLGFANMNFKGTLTDLFGASLQSENPHQEHVDEFDVRRHGGGMGVWLGLWTWSAMGSIGVGFLIGAMIIDTLNPAWGFYLSITIIAFILLLNVLTPEVRRSAFRRSVAEVKNGEDVSRRLARGEVKMHLVQTGPKWWGEEFHYGLMLSVKMLRQPGFMVMALYVAWMYGQIVLIVLLLGSLCSNSYKFKSPQVGAAVAAVPLGALLAIPFQKASIFSRERNHAPKSDDDTYKKKVKWSSHFIRRAIFVLTLPFAGLGYTLSSSGPPVPFILPILFAALIAFLSNLAMAECHGIIMETYDTSDLQPGMTGRSRGSAGDKSASKRTNYSSFPRVASAFAITQGFGYLIAAAASGIGGSLTRNLGQQAATGIMAFILLVLSVLLLGILIRFKDVQIIPDSKKGEMDQYHNARRASAVRRAEGIVEEEPWRPVIIGNPHHSTRRMCVLELGSMSRFSEIRKKNRLVDEQSLEARHPNQQMVIDVRLKIKEKELQVVEQVRRSISRGSSRGSRRSKFSDEGRGGGSREQGDLGGHREMGNMHSGNGSGRRRATNIRE